ncbi:hypothetical protein T440DRAFT_508432 [Plenodomus tracheiphilus IPT5]|uniref:Uncharacterized protein n=1 Tax=Plenodomus tracheiphilus IPT5 TaxID=1408161 RepID=A0A6A7B369_9PLEO|nr:hypothetical protein T440DRAFT_508432 [Plenodomus tracheiphilus IPT5]
MSSQDRAGSTMGENIPKASYTGFERAEETPIILEDIEVQPSEATNSIEQRESQRSPGSDANSVSPSTAPQISIDIARPLHRYHERVSVEGTVDTAEPEETHTFLHEDQPDTISLQQKTPKVNGNRVVLLTTWWTEIVSLVLAIAALIAIVVMMTEYHNKQQPEWKYKINLNTLIAILSTLMRACLVVVAEEVISQLKWMLFCKPRSLQHLAHFDKASRGPRGSVLLLFRTRTLHGIIPIIIFSVGIGPFAQQAAEAVPCDRSLESAEAIIPISRWIHTFNLARFDAAHWDMDIDTKIALLDGLANPNTTRSEITPGCSTGNCLFPSYNGVTHSSVGICKKCVDITPWVTEAVRVDNSSYRSENGSMAALEVQDLILPGGHGIGRGPIGSVPRKIMDVSGHATIWKRLVVPLNDSLLDAFDDSFDSIFRASVLNVSVITFTNNNGEKDRCSNHNFNTSYPFLDHLNVVATACAFYPCVHDYHGSVRDTVFTETVVRDTPIVQLPGQEQNVYPHFMHFHTPCLIDGQAYTMENISLVPKEGRNFTSSFVDQVNMTFPTECAYKVDGVYAMSFVDFMNETLFGDCITPSNVNFEGDPEEYNTLRCEPWYLKGLVNGGNASFQSIDHNMESVATAITSEMRKQGTGLNMISLAKNGPPVTIPIYAKGTVMQTTVCMKFNWMWLSFPLALIALTILLLCISCGKMYFDTRKIPAWKSCVLPLLLTGNQIGAATGAEDMAKIEADTKNLVVSLAHFERGWEFVVESYKDQRKKNS